MAKTAEEKIAILEKEIESKKAQVKRLKNLEKEKERKARTKRLIEIGAVVEHVLGKPIEKSDLPALQSALEELEQKNNYWLTTAMQNFSEIQTKYRGNGQ